MDIAGSSVGGKRRTATMMIVHSFGAAFNFLLRGGVVHAGGCCTSRVDIDPSTRDFNGSCVMFRHGGAVDFATEYLKAASTGSRHDLPEMKKPAVTRVTDRPLHFLAVRAHGPQG